MMVKMLFKFLNLQTGFHTPASFLILGAPHGWMTILRPSGLPGQDGVTLSSSLLSSPSLHPKGRGMERDGWSVSGATLKW